MALHVQRQGLARASSKARDSADSKDSHSTRWDLLDFQTKQQGDRPMYLSRVPAPPPPPSVRRRSCLPGPSPWTLSCHLLVKTVYIQYQTHFKRELRLQSPLRAHWAGGGRSLPWRRDILVLLHLFFGTVSLFSHASLGSARPLRTRIWL